ncbi:MAG: helix-turn-helix domain-containing protein [Spirochaetaceae bacterium]|nr:helix-turn-helix domain-containing protein [Spirochaetaceae bacterium]
MYYEATINQEPDGFNVWFEDLPGIYTCGDNLEEALLNAEDALNFVLSYPLKVAFKQPLTFTYAPNTYLIKVKKSVAFALNLRWQREALNITQAEMAKRLKINQSAYQRLEDTAKSNATLKLIERVEKALNTTLFDITYKPAAI